MSTAPDRPHATATARSHGPSDFRIPMHDQDAPRTGSAFASGKSGRTATGNQDIKIGMHRADVASDWFTCRAGAHPISHLLCPAQDRSVQTMKVILSCLCAVLTLAAFADDAPMSPRPAIPKLRTTDNVCFTNVVVTAVSADLISIQHDEGAARIPIARFDDGNLDLLIPERVSRRHLASAEATARRQREEQVAKIEADQRAVASGLRNEEAQRDAEGRRRADSEAKAKEVLARDNAETIQPIDRAAQPSTENSGSIQSSRSTPSFSGLISFIGKILGIIALVCIVAGLCWAIANWKLLKDIYDIFEVLRKRFFG